MLIVTPNPALDRTILVSSFRPGEIHRTLSVMVVAGGKGLNAARAVRNLGGNPICMGFVGGKAGRFFATLARQEGFDGSWTSMSGETRTCYIILDKSGTEPTVINEPGYMADEECWQALEIDILATLSLRDVPAGSYVCFNGSLPSGSPPSVFARLIHSVKNAGHLVWVDTSGEPLAAALEAAPAGIKVNLSEAGAVLGRSGVSSADALDLADAILKRGILSVVLTLGAEGAILANEGGIWRATTPPLNAVTNVGSGDSFFGAFILALEQHKSHPDALCDGVAAGAANTLSPGGGNFSREQFEQIRAHVKCDRLR